MTMLISCNLLNEFISSEQPIDWLNIWNKFTMTTAEVENVLVKGRDVSGVVIAKVTDIMRHPKEPNYTILTLDTGDRTINVVTSAKNAYVGMVTACCTVGGKINSKNVEEIELLGIKSEGVCLSEKELDISEEHSGIIDLPKHYSIGSDIREYIKLDDIIVEIDNKSLTNRPDLWGHYGIAREIAAITNAKLKEISILNVSEDDGKTKEKIAVDLLTNYVNRYTAIKISDLNQKNTNINMKTILHHCGYECGTLTELITSYVTLELGLPIVTLKGKGISKICLKMFDESISENSNISEENLLVYGNGKVMEVAGVCVLDNCQVTEESDCVIIEIANYDASAIRKSSIALHNRNESSIRHEKSLDPEMTLIALARCLYLLKAINGSLSVDSEIIDVYPNKQKKNTIRLTRKKLTNYLGFEMDSNTVLKILTSLGMEVVLDEIGYIVTAPTYRSTKDIGNDADVIEEITRVYGYDNLKPQPLKLDLEIKHDEASEYLVEYDIKRVLAETYNLHEVNTYIWYSDDFLKNVGIDKSYCEQIVNKPSSNYIRDDLGLSVLAETIKNARKMIKYGVFEIGTVDIAGEVKRQLSIVLCDSVKNVSDCYMKMKNIVYGTVRLLTNREVVFVEEKPNNIYMDENTVLSVYIEDICIGQIGVANIAITKKYHKKAVMIVANIEMSKLTKVEKVCHNYKKLSKYPTVYLDYTISMAKGEKFKQLEDVLSAFKSTLLKSYEVIDVYEKTDERRITIRITIGHDDRTLNTDDIKGFSDNIVSYLKGHFKVEA